MIFYPCFTSSHFCKEERGNPEVWSRMGNSVCVCNHSNIIVNFALRVAVSYTANQLKPGECVQFKDVSYVWFGVEIIPWFGKESEIWDQYASWPEWYAYYAYVQKLKIDIPRQGFGSLPGYFNVMGRELLAVDIEEPMENMRYSEWGFRLIGDKVLIWGGPTRVKPFPPNRTIDLTDYFAKINFYKTEFDHCYGLDEMPNDIHSVLRP